MADAVDVTATLRLPIATGLALQPRLGLAFWDSGSSDGVEPLVAVGLEKDFDRAFARLEVGRYFDVADDLDYATLSWGYRF